ncbi:MAG TPA: peptidylprolyl isomerase [Gemmatimonadales bacterium]|nr:peptidylprolyl isomerase [Gemmatimonadales bacterium]
MMWRTLLPLCMLLALGCKPRAASPQANKAETVAPAPDSFVVAITTSRGPVTLRVHRDWAPLGAERFYRLVQASFFDGARFFRVVKGFVVQFGLPADAQVGRAWVSRVIADDPVRHSNRRGTIVFASAGPNSRTTQLFINLADNPRLDTFGRIGFPPIGMVTDGMAVVDALNGEYGETPSQDAIQQYGNAYLDRLYPRLDYIRTARVVQEWR